MAMRAAITPDEMSEEARTVVDTTVSVLLGTEAEDIERPVVASCMTALEELCRAIPPGYMSRHMVQQASPIVHAVAGAV
jgi:hypothetical protein